LGLPALRLAAHPIEGRGIVAEWRDSDGQQCFTGIMRDVTARNQQARELAARKPDTQLVIDHLGLQQPFEPPPPAQPFADLPKVLELAAQPNIAIKITGACTLSQKPYPFPDIWEPLARVFDAWGFDRCLWGTDWTRAFAVVNYEQAVVPFVKTDRLSDSERAMLMGGACAKAYGWSPKKA